MRRKIKLLLKQLSHYFCFSFASIKRRALDNFGNDTRGLHVLFIFTLPPFLSCPFNSIEIPFLGVNSAVIRVILAVITMLLYYTFPSFLPYCLPLSDSILLFPLLLLLPYHHFLLHRLATGQAKHRRSRNTEYYGYWATWNIRGPRNWEKRRDQNRSERRDSLCT